MIAGWNELQAASERDSINYSYYAPKGREGATALVVLPSPWEMERAILMPELADNYV